MLAGTVNDVICMWGQTCLRSTCHAASVQPQLLVAFVHPCMFLWCPVLCHPAAAEAASYGPSQGDPWDWQPTTWQPTNCNPGSDGPEGGGSGIRRPQVALQG